jgi:hypothetical protein
MYRAILSYSYGISSRSGHSSCVDRDKTFDVAERTRHNNVTVNWISSSIVSNNRRIWNPAREPNNLLSAAAAAAAAAATK